MLRRPLPELAGARTNQNVRWRVRVVDGQNHKKNHPEDGNSEIIGACQARQAETIGVQRRRCLVFQHVVQRSLFRVCRNLRQMSLNTTRERNAA